MFVHSWFDKRSLVARKVATGLDVKMEKIAESTLLNKVGKICMFQANVHKLITNINKH